MYRNKKKECKIMKKIGIFIGSLVRDGAERVTICLSDYLVRHGVECYIFTRNRAEHEYNVPQHVKRININSKGKFGCYLQDIIHLRKVIQKSQIEELLIMDLPACLYAIPACYKMDVKIVVSERNDPASFAGKKIVAKLSRYLMDNADGYVFQTKDALNFYKTKYLDCATVIPNPIIVNELPEPYVGRRKKEIVTAGRLNPQKNQKLLIDAFYEIHKMYPDYVLTIYGDGGLRDELEKYINILKLSEFVKLPGNVPNLLECIHQAGMFVLCSNFEGIPNVLIEALAIGLPSISTDCPCGGPRSLIDDYDNGLLFPVNDKEKLIDAIKFFIENPKEADRMGKEAVLIRKKLDSEVICKRWSDYLKKCLETK